MTYAERIRQLTDEELACYLIKVQINGVLEFFSCNFGSFGQIAPPGEETQKEMEETMLKLLQQEAPDDKR